MEKFIFDSPGELGRAAATAAVTAIRHAIDEKQSAHIILATGASQFETLSHLTRTDQIDWSKVTMFHLDEYIGLDESHPASFVRYLKERFVDEVGDLKAVHFINGQAEDAQQECRRLGEILSEHPVDVGLIGIGENGHLAFNDPPADFETEEATLIVELDEACRTQTTQKKSTGRRNDRRLSIRNSVETNIILYKRASIYNLRATDFEFVYYLRHEFYQ